MSFRLSYLISIETDLTTDSETVLRISHLLAQMTSCSLLKLGGDLICKESLDSDSDSTASEY